MNEITACHSCTKQNRVPSAATARRTGALPAPALAQGLDAHDAA